MDATNPFTRLALDIKSRNEGKSGGLRLLNLPAVFLDRLGRGLDFWKSIKEICDNYRCRGLSWNASFLQCTLLVSATSYFLALVFLLIVHDR